MITHGAGKIHSPAASLFRIPGLYTRGLFVIECRKKEGREAKMKFALVGASGYGFGYYLRMLDERIPHGLDRLTGIVTVPGTNG